MSTSVSITAEANEKVQVRLYGKIVDDLKFDSSNISDSSLVPDRGLAQIAYIYGAKIAGLCVKRAEPLMIVVAGGGVDPVGCPEFSDKSQYRMWTMPIGSDAIAFAQRVDKVEFFLKEKGNRAIDADFRILNINVNGSVISGEVRSYLHFSQDLPWPLPDVDVTLIDRNDRFEIDIGNVIGVLCIPVFSIEIARLQVCYHPNPNRICGEIRVDVPVFGISESFPIACVTF